VITFFRALHRAFVEKYFTAKCEREAERIAKWVSESIDSMPKPQWEPREGEVWLDINMDVFDFLPPSEEEEKFLAELRKKRLGRWAEPVKIKKTA
jgi:hypothetical protein